MDIPAPQRLAPDVWHVSSPIPEGQISHTLTYVLAGDDRRVHLIDPGWGSADNLAALEHKAKLTPEVLAAVEAVMGNRPAAPQRF